MGIQISASGKFRRAFGAVCEAVHLLVNFGQDHGPVPGRCAPPCFWRDGYRYKKAGVILPELHPASVVQERLFDEAFLGLQGFGDRPIPEAAR